MAISDNEYFSHFSTFPTCSANPPNPFFLESGNRSGNKIYLPFLIEIRYSRKRQSI